MEILKITYCSKPEDLTPSNDQTIYTSEPLIFYPDQTINGSIFQVIETINGREFFYLGTKASLLNYLTANKITV